MSSTQAQSSPDMSTPGAVSTPVGQAPADNSADTSGSNSDNSDQTSPAQPANAQGTHANPAPDLSPGQNPDQSQAAPNPQVPNTPLLPQMPGNAFTPFSPTSAISTAQSPQITSPQLYTTGTRDLSQIATNTQLRQAFSDVPSTEGFLSNEQEGGYSYPPIERVRLGPFDLKAALSTSIVYDDNLRVNGIGDSANNNTGSRGDTSYTVTPAVLLEYGAHEGQRGYASVVYAPTFERFFHHSDQNTDQYQNVAFNAQYPFDRLTLNMSQTYAETAGVNTDTNSRTVQTSSQTSVGAGYQVDDKVSVSVGLQYTDTSFSAPQGQNTPGQVVGQGSETSSANTTVSFKLTDKLSLNPSVNFGISKPDDAPQQFYEQTTLGLGYQPTEKINLFAQAGMEIDQYEAGQDDGVTVQSGTKANPIFSAGIGYAPFDSTTFVLSAAQAIRSSDVDSGQTVADTSLSIGATQRFFQRLFLNTTFSYDHVENQGNYGNSATTLDIGNQDTFSYRASLSIAPTAWTSASLYYQYLDNQSDIQGQTYHDNQIGLALSAQF